MRLAERVVAGENDYPHFAQGWHDRSRDGRCAVEYRAVSGEEGVLVLRRSPAATRLMLLLSGPRGLSEGPLRGSIVLNETVHAIELDFDLWVVREIPLPKSADDSPQGLCARFVLPNPPCPNDVLHNGDSRRMGWYVSAAWQE